MLFRQTLNSSATLFNTQVVPEEQMWLTVLKYIGYSLSFIFIIAYIIIVAVAK